LRWQTNGFMTVGIRATLATPSIDVEFDLQGWDLAVLDPYLDQLANVRLQESELSFAGKTRLEIDSDEQARGSFEGGLRLANLQTLHALDEDDLLRWQSFSADGIRAKLSPPELSIERVELAGPEVWATLNPDGTVNLLTAANLTNALVQADDVVPPSTAEDETSPLSDTVDVEEVGAQVTVTASQLPPVQVASVVLTDATLHLADRMSKPDTRITVKPFNGELRGLSSTNLMKADFDFAGELQPAGTFAVNGRVRPLDGPDATQVTLTTKGVDLTPTDPYIQRFAGYELERGAVSTDLSFELLNRQLKATNHVVLDNFTLGSKVDSPDALKVPVKLGLAVLQDREGRIDLTVPMEGSLDDPQFDIGQVIRGAFANVLTKVVTSPFNILGSMFGSKEEELQEVEFQPGESELAEGQQHRVDKLEEILYQRPALGLEITGAADLTQDGQVLKHRQLLTQLSKLREQLIVSGSTNLGAAREPLDPTGPVYAQLVTEAYAQAKGITLRPATPPADPAEAPTVSTLPATAEPPEVESPPVRRAPKRFMRGGERMMELSRMRRQSRSESVTSSPPPEPDTEREPSSAAETRSEPGAVTPSLPPIETMNSFLLDQIIVQDDALLGLAESRADQVRAKLLESGRTEADRLRLKTLSGRPPSGTKVRIAIE
jgi:hypothetical protein